MKKWIKRLFFGGIIVLGLTLWANYSVYYESKAYVHNSFEKLPEKHVGLLLGTSRTLRNGNINRYFQFRIDAAVELFNSGKIKHILISGDNGHVGYNEPEDMQLELIKRGIPVSKIHLDYAGFDTYDSVIRAKKVFGQNGFIVISQHFHNQRAVYIARRFGIDAYGFNAKNVTKRYGIKVKIREFFACVKAYVEVKLNVDPHFLGEEITIE